MTTLLISAKRLPDGRIVLTNRKGEELPIDCVPSSVYLSWRSAIANRNPNAYNNEETLSAASVDVSEAVVEIPESLRNLESNFVEYRHPQYGLGAFCTPDVYDTLDALMAKIKGEK